MGKKSSPSPPPAPDYAAAATAQGQANTAAARTGAELTNTNQITPYGSQTFTKDPNSDQWTSTVSLSPEQQNLYNLQTQGDTQLGQMANSQLSRVNDAVSKPLDLSGAPARVNSVNPVDYSLYGGTPAANQQFAGSTPNYSTLNGDIANTPDYAAQAKEVQDSLYRSATAQLDPQYQQLENSERTRLINSGVPEGSEAFNNALDTFNRQRTAAYGDARDRAIQGGGAEQSRLNQDYLANNAQRFGEQAQTTNTNNATQAQRYADALTALGFNNTASNQDLNNTLATLGFNNQANSQTFNNDIAAGNFQNQNRGAAIDEASYLQSQPLNLYNALNSGAQVTNPQFRNTGTPQGPAAAPTFAATQAADQRAIDLYNAQLAGSGSAKNGLFGALGNIAGSALGGYLGR